LFATLFISNRYASSLPQTSIYDVCHIPAMLTYEFRNEISNLVRVWAKALAEGSRFSNLPQTLRAQERLLLHRMQPALPFSELNDSLTLFRGEGADTVHNHSPTLHDSAPCPNELLLIFSQIIYSPLLSMIVDFRPET